MPETPLPHRAVRDLAWACFSSPLPGTSRLAPDITAFAPKITPARRRWLNSLVRDPGPLLAHLAGHPHTRLGLYFEALWHFFLARDPSIELLAHNLAIRDGSKTVGEFDCLYFCREQRRHFHLELAVKFYLGYDHRWLGPNARDRLDLKLTRLEGHQLRLADHPAATETLQRLGIVAPGRQVAVRGRLFPPLHHQNRLAPAAGRDAESILFWLPQGQLGRLLDGDPCDPKSPDGNSRYALLGRDLWLSAADPREAGDRLNAAALEAWAGNHFSRGGRPLLVARFDDKGVEGSRFFVTPDNWPAVE